jgi:eukaryotic-like serine/threonine-protein kinase
MHDALERDQIFAGRYRIQRFLAKGGFGAVYAAEQIDTEAQVALKVLWPNVLETKAALEQFSLEARVASRIASEHVVRVFDVGADAKTHRPFLAMELLVGQHFEELVERNGPIAWGDLAVYFLQIGSALDKAHGYVDKSGARRPIVHRDLKPENLFLTRRENGDPLVKILDFGLAKVLSQSANTSRELKGTPLFMAFEQAAVAPVTPQTDIWALGLIAFYLLTGRIYWISANTDESPFSRLFTEVLSSPFDPPSERARAIGCEVVLPDGFDAWFERCVNRDAALRFETAGECALALSRLVRADLQVVTPITLDAKALPLLGDSKPTVRSPTPFSASFERARSSSASNVVRRRHVMQLFVASLVTGLVVTIVLLVAGFRRAWIGETARSDVPGQATLPPVAVSNHGSAPQVMIARDASPDRPGARAAAQAGASAAPSRSARPVLPASSGGLPSYVYGER